MRYQPIWLNGAELSLKHQRKCADRYEPMKAVFGSYRRPFTVLDIGANMGWFSFNISADYDATCILVDRKPELGELCQKNGGKLIWLDSHLTGNQILKLSKCEHFDVILALNVLHYIKDWPLAVKGLFDLCDHLIVETPVPTDPATTVSTQSDYAAILATLFSKRHQLIGEFKHKGRDARPLMWFSPLACDLTKQTLDADERKAPPVNGIKVRSDFGNKVVSIKRHGQTETRFWLHGMNLWNWKLLSGAYPARQKVNSMVERAVSQLGRPHDDLVPWNFILDGESVRCIDHSNKSKLRPGRNLEQCLTMLDRPSPWSAGSGA